jgi:hypothetical protein
MRRASSSFANTVAQPWAAHSDRTDAGHDLAHQALAAILR